MKFGGEAQDDGKGKVNSQSVTDSKGKKIIKKVIR